MAASRRRPELTPCNRMIQEHHSTFIAERILPELLWPAPSRGGDASCRQRAAVCLSEKNWSWVWWWRGNSIGKRKTLLQNQHFPKHRLLARSMKIYCLTTCAIEDLNEGTAASFWYGESVKDVSGIMCKVCLQNGPVILR